VLFGLIELMSMKIIVHCIHRDGWSVQSGAEDLKILLSPFVPVESLAVLRKLLRCAVANDSEMAEFERQIASWSHGHCWISDLTEVGAKLLKIDTRKMISLAPR
jgi:hypothetical protein